MAQQAAVSEPISDPVHAILEQKLWLGPFQLKVVKAGTVVNCAGSDYTY